MFSRSALRTALNVRKTPFFQIQPPTSTTTTRLPTTPTTSFLQRSNLHNEPSSTAASSSPSTTTTTTTTTTDPNPAKPLDATPRAQSDPPADPLADLIRSKEPLPPTFTSPLRVTKSLIEKLPYLYAQRQHFVTAHLHAKAYLVTSGDEVRLPFRMPNVEPGDILRLNRVSALGSREFTLKGTPYIDERLFECRVRVMGCDGEPMRIIEKTKRRQRHVKHVKSKGRFTLIRVMEVRLKSVDEILAEGAEVVNDGTEDGTHKVVARG